MYFVSNTLDDIVSRGKDVYRRTSILLRMETTPLLETINFTMGVRFILLDIYIYILLIESLNPFYTFNCYNLDFLNNCLLERDDSIESSRRYSFFFFEMKPGKKAVVRSQPGA